MTSKRFVAAIFAFAFLAMGGAAYAGPVHTPVTPNMRGSNRSARAHNVTRRPLIFGAIVLTGSAA